ncbi:SpoIIE family protein phosphatase [Sphaerisporangium sp. B11E5]|uniref:PP2C family protein-serine/threonine phosphatase n=1 Tax=Sphaerisporangium sp. B11E5 TaxID=3153563 RepID=UPI00325E8350
MIKDPRSRVELRVRGDASVQERLAFLNDASTRIGSTLDLAQTCREVVDVAVPRIADASGIMVQERLITQAEFPGHPTDSGALVRRLATAVAVADPWAWDTAFPAGEVTVYPPYLPQAQAMATAKTVIVPRLDRTIVEDNARAFERPIISRLLLDCSFLVTPLIARGIVLGYVVLVREPSSDPFQETDAALAEELAARTAICIDNARLYHRERRTALTLQSSLLPTRLHRPPGLEIAHRYLPAGNLEGVGGDWFDVIPLPRDRTALVVGDVMGHGIGAAATMGQLRTATQTLATLDLDPAELLFQLDRVARRLHPDHIATCAYATYDPASGAVAVASAGHVPPVLVPAGGAPVPLPVVPGPPLGVGGERVQLCTATMPPGAMLALYTDGLVETRDRGIDVGIAVLCSLLGGPPRDLERVCDTITEVCRQVDERDDMALLLARAVGNP